MIFGALIWIVAAFMPSFADSGDREKTAFEQELEKYADFKTQERWVDVKGTRYREVIYGGKKYYIKFTGREGDYGELDCNGPSGLNPSMVEAAAEVYHRTKMFISFIQESCDTDPQGQKRLTYKLDPRIGFTIPDDKKSAITNKKVFVSPFGLGFSGDW